MQEKSCGEKEKSKRINYYIQREIDEEEKKRRFGEEETDKFKRIGEHTRKEKNVWRVRKKKGIIFMLIINHVNYMSFGSIAIILFYFFYQIILCKSSLWFVFSLTKGEKKAQQG